MKHSRSHEYHGDIETYHEGVIAVYRTSVNITAEFTAIEDAQEFLRIHHDVNPVKGNRHERQAKYETIND